MTEPSIHPQTFIGHVHLKVSDLDRAVKFYTEVLGFEVMARLGQSAAFLSAGGYHHHLGLNTWESAGGPPPPPGGRGRAAPGAGRDRPLSLRHSAAQPPRTGAHLQTRRGSRLAD